MYRTRRAYLLRWTFGFEGFEFVGRDFSQIEWKTIVFYLEEEIKTFSTLFFFYISYIYSSSNLNFLLQDEQLASAFEDHLTTL